jgi:hypothetical protein
VLAGEEGWFAHELLAMPKEKHTAMHATDSSVGLAIGGGPLSVLDMLVNNRNPSNSIRYKA